MLCINSGWLRAQSTAVKDFQVKAAFIYNLSQFISWPSHCFATETAPFVITVLGNNNLGNYLQQLAGGEIIDKHPVIIRSVNHKSLVSSDCHILFLDESIEKKIISELLINFRGKNSLTVSDAVAFLEQGGMVSFQSDHNRLRLSLNLPAFKITQLTVSSKLIKLSKSAATTNEKK